MAKTRWWRVIPSTRRCRSSKGPTESRARVARWRSAGGGCSRAGERRKRAPGWGNCSGRASPPRGPPKREPSHLDRKFRAKVRNFRPPEISFPRGESSGLPPARTPEKGTQKLDMIERQHWFKDEMGLRRRFQTVIIWYYIHNCKMQR